LRPVEPRVLEGPCVEVVDVYCLDGGAQRAGWMCDDCWPGVQVVEGPVSVGPSNIVVAVEPGARAVITGTRVPWQVRRATPEVAARVAMSAQFTQELSRRHSRVSDSRAAYLVNEQGERVLSVRLHDKCEHKEDHWERKTCGHVWCNMCNGHVHPGTRVALRGYGHREV
jgi:hypothetical protein